VTICNQFRKRRPDTQHHRASDHSTRHRPLPTYWRSFETRPLSPAINEILASKCIWVTTLIFRGSRDVIGHVTIWYPGSHIP